MQDVLLDREQEHFRLHTLARITLSCEAQHCLPYFEVVPAHKFVERVLASMQECAGIKVTLEMCAVSFYNISTALALDVA